MEGNLSQGSMEPGLTPYGGLDLQGSMRAPPQGPHPHTIRHQHQLFRCQSSSVHTSMHEGFPLTMGAPNASDQPVSVTDFSMGEKGKNSVSDEDDPSFSEEGIDDQHDANRGKKGWPWQRVKWTDKMVRLLINVVSYVGEDVASDSSAGFRRKFAFVQKKGKWKAISNVMTERGFKVSPQQCEDKFNDLNKRYKKLNEMLGRGTSCEVVENPALLDVLSYLTEKEKDDVRKILSSKQLFYEEMCSFRNGNRLHLPHDPALQHSLQLALGSRNDCDNDARRNQHDDPDEDYQDVDTDDRDEYGENHDSHVDTRGLYGVLGCSRKRMRQDQGQDDVCFVNSLGFQDCDNGSYSHPQVAQTDVNKALPESGCSRSALLEKHCVEAQTLQLEEQKLQIQANMMELEKERFKWERCSKKKDRELEKLRIENERMKLENERMALELKRKEMEAGLN
ncbi:hypothetical protein HS088_TW15G00859 [Tripterygium wilfordii]|uniref:Myb/SANT-like DNA-binding domain-containing protein n=1 Tax=Tripterygium wilfordii TaxID=458696 RepID=A0A7J7CMP4_TRIWF|nr:uncharacterized protein LOC120017139 [Tripterygium wilfordii]XP_038726170.1 uncharacterized protein LOC120017139 [Tripterygium wilfordii]XP_038726171.1 uncharacterized protein LOC120017139 [Tripterygium wilfordii]XP_038726172.1 uncharacterized protein LOC120017139 [Tripterygium wilfordii]XP_038726173.1 uncharacterized protein LOC120017139 [Tripterygium wilfordii]XP_038726174.1 uncharacterized protein LOC120017139 [Tripterygium wilfordii]KAF5735357.1 hypothetical protein HS088_TW15G00859 [T